MSIWAKDVINVKSDNSCYQQQDLRTSPLNAGNYTSLMSMHFLLKFSKKLESIFCIVNLTQIKKQKKSFFTLILPVQQKKNYENRSIISPTKHFYMFLDVLTVSV